MSSKQRRMLRKGIGYIRVSRRNGRDGDSFISPEVQRERIEAIAKANGIRIVHWIEEIDQSGKKWDRPGFQEALDLIEAKQASVIVVARMSRFARSVIDVEKALQRMEAVTPPGQLLAGDLNVDTTTPQGKLMRTILSAIAQFELEVHAENWTTAKKRAIGKGKHIGRAPVGYTNGDGKPLRIDPELGPIVQEIFARRAKGASWADLVRLWIERTGEIRSPQSFQHLIKNRVYLGEVRHGKGEDEIVNLEAHPALVTVEEFEAAQLEQRPARTARRNGSLLGGIMRCGTCGGVMSAGSLGEGRGFRYGCKGTSARGFCPHPQSVMAHLADPVVEEKFLAWAKEQRSIVEGNGSEEESLEAALRAVEDAEAELTAFASVTRASANPELFASGIEERELVLEAARDRVDELRASGKVETLALNAVELWEGGDQDARRRLLAGSIERLEVHASARGTRFEDRSVIEFRR